MKKLKFQKPTGMHDILGFDQRCFEKISDKVKEIAEFYSFNKIDTPILEDCELFNKGVGLITDIIQKEMYTLKTKGGDCLALRPEGTASVVRAYIEHGMFSYPQPVKLYYMGPFFRYERPQSGRYRQFWQFGFETIGEDHPVYDAQIIQIACGFFSDLNIAISLEINSIGDKECRPAYRRILVRYLKSKSEALCSDCKKRTKDNPLRVLDCKNQKCKEIIDGAPQIMDHLCPDCHSHFKKTLEYLDEMEVSYQLNPHLVRGLDYYTRTVFEFSTLKENEKTLALGGGGRYDKLVKNLGGKDTPAVGVSFGVERIAELMKQINYTDNKKQKNRVFLAQLGDIGKRKSLKLMGELRKHKVATSESFGKDSLKTQMTRASRIGCKVAIIIGQTEALNNSAIIKDMDTGEQKTIEIKDIVMEIKRQLKS
ncbi:MAG: histidine--tRNA ligase [Candidatus Pacebacteria bacterium]|nr:histidine--tRNA ligase [Candidatus Paceibacterota bacterium]